MVWYYIIIIIDNISVSEKIQHSNANTCLQKKPIECPMFQNQITDICFLIYFSTIKTTYYSFKNINSFYINASKTNFLQMFLYIRKKSDQIFSFLKELEHRKLGWELLILKYDLGKSLSKELWCKTAETKKNWLHI